MSLSLSAVRARLAELGEKKLFVGFSVEDLVGLSFDDLPEIGGVRVGPAARSRGAKSGNAGYYIRRDRQADCVVVEMSFYQTTGRVGRGVDFERLRACARHVLSRRADLGEIERLWIAPGRAEELDLWFAVQIGSKDVARTLLHAFVLNGEILSEVVSLLDSRKLIPAVSS